MDAESDRPPLFVLYDMRAADGDPDNAAVLCSARGEAEALRDTAALGFEGIWYEYPVLVESEGPDKPGKCGEGKPRYDLPPFNAQRRRRRAKRSRRAD